MPKRRFDEELEKINHINRNEMWGVLGLIIVMGIVMCLALWAVYKMTWSII